MAISKDKIVDTMIAMAEVAADAGLCGSWYPTKDETVAAICLKPAPKPGQMCAECDQRNEDWSNGDYRKFSLVQSKQIA